MKNLKTDILINAPADRVWDILMDFEKYPEWNPFIQSIEGSPEEGQQISVTMKLEGKSPQTFRPEVLVKEENKEFRWLGHLFIQGLFDGEHFFIIEPAKEGQVKFVQGEHFGGILSGLIMKLIGDNTRKGFEAMNKALKKRSETSS